METKQGSVQRRCLVSFKGQLGTPECLNSVCGGGNPAPCACPVGVEELTPRFVDTLISVRAKVVALGL